MIVYVMVQNFESFDDLVIQIQFFVEMDLWILVKHVILEYLEISVEHDFLV